MNSLYVAVPGLGPNVDPRVGPHPDDLRHPPDDPRDAPGLDELGPDQPVTSQ